MELLIKTGQKKQALRIATSDPLFIDIQIRDLARKMSTRDESVRAPLSDFVATFAGVARDNLNAKMLLTGDFFYQADPALTIINGQQRVRSDLSADIVSSNNHYSDITTNQFSMYKVLTRKPQSIAAAAPQQNVATPVMTSPIAAGLLTTRAWTQAHADAGTNRRLVEFTFRQFMCKPITEWADATSPDDFVGRDVDRFPGSSNEKYQVTCKGCHGNMDGLRGAFAKIDFTNNILSYIPATNPGSTTGVATKMNRNNTVFSEGKQVTNDSWRNYATEGKNADQFGWRGALSGNGIKEFAAMIAESKGFSRCLTKRVFTSVCKREPASGDEKLIRTIADEFEAADYQLKALYENVANRPECLGQ